MKKKLILAILFSISTVLNSGCKLIKTEDVISIPSDNIADIEVNSNKNENMFKEEKFFAPFTGEEVNKENSLSIPFMTIIENSRDARPQSGLSEADIVYETMAEGGIPRFIALFQKNAPKEIGPVRSARPYFNTIAKEYNLPFAHCGGSPEALDLIKSENLMSLNEMSFGSYYYRDKSRKAPHNLYTTAEKLRALISNKNYLKPPKFPHSFNDQYWSSSKANTTNQIHIKLNKYYNTSYEYKNGEYHKSMDNVVSIDRFNNKPLTAKNIVVQITDIKLKEDGSRLDIALVGEGEGFVISNGKYEKVKWMKRDENSPTILMDEDGKTLPLHAGKTWWHITDKNLDIQFK